jgi:hypothetical protein
MKVGSKHAAMEMSMGTIVTIVLLLIVLIMGVFFVTNIMCAGITLTDQVTSEMENEIKNLFGTSDYGIKCMGEGGHEVKLGDGGKKQIACIINTDTTTEYDLKVKSVESLKGTTTDTVQRWILDQDWSGIVSAGEKTVTVLVLDIPKKVSSTTLKIEIEEENKETGTTETHISYIDVIHVGGLRSAVC